jgi:hypothetical protein
MPQTVGMEMVDVLFQKSVMVEEEIKFRKNGSIKQSYFGMLYMGRAMWN